MNIIEYIEAALLELNSIQSKIEEIQRKITNAEWQSDSQTLQKLRCSFRFLLRYYQYHKHQIQKMDFLAALRDFVLFIGRLSAPEDICTLVSSDGGEFGLYVEGNEYINAYVNCPGWFVDDAFVQQVYGKLQADVFKKGTACGDEILYKATGFKSYRSFEQKIAVHTALNMPDGYTLLLSLPTGAGKSLLTQMLAAHGDGLTVAIVPTVALGLDQLRAASFILKNSLTSDQIGCYCGEVEIHELRKIYNGIEDGSLKLLITSPEAIIRNDKLKKSLFLAAERKAFNNLVIDEAHIVQDWGALFRPDFQMLSVIRKELFTLGARKLKTILLSATLTEDTVANLKTLFSNNEQWIELRCDSLRTEPRFYIEKAKNQFHLQQRVSHYCKVLPKPLIIYEIKPEKAEEWKKFLSQEGFGNVVTFTGDTDDDRRTEIINMWSEDRLDMVVATSAFGLGVDKPDVRTVIHTTLPENINRFYQEVGRGGRDGLPSLSVLCYSPHDDMSIQHYIVNSRVMTVEKMIDRWFSMLRQDDAERDGDSILLDTSITPSSFSESEKENSGSQNIRWNINLLLFMKRYGFLEFNEMMYIPQQKCYFIRVTMRDVYLMQNTFELKIALEPFREQEVQSVASGYVAIKEMVAKTDKMCWSNYFTQLFPNAPLACGGCPNHKDAFSNDEFFSMHNNISWYAQVPIKSGALNKLLSGLNSLIVARNENEPLMVQITLQLAAKLNDLGIGVLVMPNTHGIDPTVFRGIVLEAKEFEFLAKHHPSILASGVLCVFDDDTRTNQITYRAANSVRQYGTPMIYYCRENMFIAQDNRPIRHLITGNTVSAAEILEV